MKLSSFTAALVVTLATVASASAAGVSAGVGPSTLPTDFTGDIVSGINIGTVNDPIEFYIDPNGPRWPKQITLDLPDGLGPGQLAIPVTEHLRLVPPPPGVPSLPLWDWHEVIHTPGWEWTSGGVITVSGADGTVSMREGGVATPDPSTGEGSAIWFDPIEPHPILPADIWIDKRLRYRGPTIPPGTTVLDIWEYPTTPEPSSWAMCGIGAIMLYGLRRQRIRAVMA